jgi:hypothetical protein
MNVVTCVSPKGERITNVDIEDLEDLEEEQRDARVESSFMVQVSTAVSLLATRARGTLAD